MLGEHGSFRRYVMTAMVNFLAFYSLWELFVLILPDGGYWPTVSWAIAWFLGSLQAHWTHRIWTFDSDRDIKWTTACNYIVKVAWGFDERITFLVNSSLWGFLNYLGQREIAFKEISTSHPSENE